MSRLAVRPVDVARAAFVVAAVGFAWWGLREHRSEIVAALAATSPARVLAAGVLVLGGLAVTGAVWHGLLAAFGHDVAPRRAAAIFFVGQLGKYIPGSVWSLGAQAEMARAFRVPARTTVAVGLLFLWVHLVTAVGVGLAAGGWAGWGGWSVLLGAGLGTVAIVVGLAPALLARLAGLLAPDRLQVTWTGWGGVAGIAARMAAVWCSYGLATRLVLPPEVVGPGWVGPLGSPGAALPWAPGVTALGAFAASYVVGVLVVLAPAGVGAREAVLVGLLAPAVGLGTAVATALLIRVVHTVADVVVAGLAWLVGRRDPLPADVSSTRRT